MSTVPEKSRHRRVRDLPVFAVLYLAYEVLRVYRIKNITFLPCRVAFLSGPSWAPVFLTVRIINGTLVASILRKYVVVNRTRADRIQGDVPYVDCLAERVPHTVPPRKLNEQYVVTKMKEAFSACFFGTAVHPGGFTAEESDMKRRARQSGRCQHPGCTTARTFGRDGDKQASYCGVHKQEGAASTKASSFKFSFLLCVCVFFYLYVCVVLSALEMGVKLVIFLPPTGAGR